MGGGTPFGSAGVRHTRSGDPGRAPRALPGGAVMRSATAGDQPAIRWMIRRAGINPLGLGWRRFVVVETSDGILACGQVKVHGDGSRELASLAVAERWQGRGLARAIIEHLQRQVGPPLWLTCRARLVPLYTRFGFREVTEARELSPYFRRLMRLARVILRIVRPEEGLAVMLWPESCTNPEDRPVGG